MRSLLLWVAAVAVAVVLFVTLHGAGHPIVHLGRPFPQATWTVLVTTVVLALPATLVRRRPVPVLVLLLGEPLVFSLAGHGDDVIVLVQFLAANAVVCFIAATRDRRLSILAGTGTLGVLAVGVVGQGLTQHPSVPAAWVVALALAVVVAWTAGHSLRQRRDHLEALRDQAASRAVMTERLRIARELHDMVAHSIGIIAIQAGTGSRVIDTQPAEARNALSAIETTSRDTLAGLRRMLVALRQADADPMGTSPPAGLADLERLVASTAAAGVQVEVTWRGRREPLPAEIDLSAFRIIQEAVTNVVRHAQTTSCHVTLEYRADELAIEVIDDGSGAPTAGAGYGVAGMRERASLMHGTLSAGPRPEGGFRVTAVLPR
jgi:signal transduction histidine kinase